MVWVSMICLKSLNLLYIFTGEDICVPWPMDTFSFNFLLNFLHLCWKINRIVETVYSKNDGYICKFYTKECQHDINYWLKLKSKVRCSGSQEPLVIDSSNFIPSTEQKKYNVRELEENTSFNVKYVLACKKCFKYFCKVMTKDVNFMKACIHMYIYNMQIIICH